MRASHVKGVPHYCSRDCLNGTLAERFWSRVQKTDGCWLWTGGLDSKGYGQLRIGGNSRGLILAHRVSWDLHNGPIPHRTNVLHQCDNPPCVRPDHLFLGDQQTNMRDCAAKDRNTFGERSHTAKLTEAQVRDIRRRYARGIVLQSDLAVEYGISAVTIYNVCARMTWRRVSD